MHQPTKKPQWLAAAIGFVACWLLSTIVTGTLSGNEPSTYVLGRVVGGVLLSAIAMMIVLRHSPVWFRLVWLGTFVLFMSGVNGIALLVRDQQRKEQQLYSDISTATVDLQRAMETSTGTTSRPIRETPVRPDDDDPYAIAGYLMKRVVQQRTESQARYEAELEAAGWGLLTEPKELLRPDARKAADARIAGARKALDDWLARERRITLAFLNDMRSKNLPADFARGVEAGASKLDMEQDFKRVRDSERAIIDASAAMVDALLRHRWVYENDELMFYTDQGLEAYRAASERLQASVRASDALKAEKRQRLTEIRETMGGPGR
jgi:hypothetical protein